MAISSLCPAKYIYIDPSTLSIPMSMTCSPQNKQHNSNNKRNIYDLLCHGLHSMCCAGATNPCWALSLRNEAAPQPENSKIVPRHYNAHRRLTPSLAMHKMGQSHCLIYIFDFSAVSSSDLHVRRRGFSHEKFSVFRRAKRADALGQCVRHHPRKKSSLRPLSQERPLVF